MKIYSYISMLLLAGATIFVSCSQDEEQEGKNTQSAQGFQINVSDGGFQDITPGATRATESDYSTKFVEGDAIGIFAVKNEAVVGEITNRRFVMQDGVWTLDDDGDPIEYKGSEYQKMSFYAYYPYNKNVTFEPTKTNPFETYVANWKVGANQEIGEYTKYDLMTSIGVVEGDRLKGKIAFTMKHQMALAVVKMPKLTYSFTNAGMDDYMLPVTVGSFTLNDAQATPYYQTNTDTYRFLVNPKKSFSIKGTYVGKDEMKYAASGTLEGGTAKMYVINDPNKIEHTLAIGDYFCADGRIVSKAAATVPDNVIGVVCYAGNPQPSVTRPANYTETNDALRRDFPNCKHGVVLSVNNAINPNAPTIPNVDYAVYSVSNQFHENKDLGITYGDWFSKDDEWTGKFDNCNTANSTTVPETRYPAFMGYNNTKLLTMCYEGKGNQKACSVAYGFITAYRKAVTTPAGTTTPWYIPSVVCWNQVATNLSTINGSLAKVANAEQMVSSTSATHVDHYWTSTQRNGATQWAHGMEGGNYALTCERAGNRGYFRMMLAF